MGQDGHMTELSAKEVVAATAEPIHTIGTNIYLSPQTFARAAEWGWTNPFSFYFAGRGAPLGEVSPSLVAAAMGWFNPAVVTAMYQEGVGVAGVKAAADKMLEATALWGRDHYGDFDGVDRFVVLGDRLVDGAEGAGLPLFVGWRGQVRADDGPARAAQLFQILREWRGAAHLAATTAVGLTPLEAILTNEGEGQAKFFGWAEPFVDASAKKALHDEAEEMTNRQCERDFDVLFTPAERSEFADLVTRAEALSAN